MVFWDFQALNSIGQDFLASYEQNEIENNTVLYFRTVLYCIQQCVTQIKCRSPSHVF